MSESTTLLDFNSLLDGNLDQVADIPDYVTPPVGNYMLKVEEAELDQSKDKAGNDVIRMIVTMSIVATLETEELPVADGSMFAERFQYTEEGQKYFKRFARNVLNVSDLNGVSLRDIFATLKDVAPFKAVITHSESKAADGTVYTNVRMRPVHEVAAV